MHKVFLKSQSRALYLGLLIASTPAIAGYSSDPDCAVVSNAAQESGERVSAAIDNVARNTAASIGSAKSCVDQVLSTANRAVSNFDFGSFSGIASQLSQSLANQACQLISQGQSAANNAVNSQVSSATSGIPSSVTQAATQAVGGSSASTSSSLWSRFANLF